MKHNLIIFGLLALLFISTGFADMTALPYDLSYKGIQDKTAEVNVMGSKVATMTLVNDIVQGNGGMTYFTDCDILLCHVKINLTLEQETSLSDTNQIIGKVGQSTLGKTAFIGTRIYESRQAEVPIMVDVLTNETYKIGCVNNSKTGLPENCTDRIVYYRTQKEEGSKIIHIDGWYDLDDKYVFKAKTTYQLSLDYAKTDIKDSADLIPSVMGMDLTKFGWWNASWGWVQQVCFNSTVSSNLTNFPGRADINTSNVTLFNTTRCDNVRWISPDNTTVLSYEVDDNSSTFCGNATNNATYWVKVPDFQANALYCANLYLGNTEASNGQNVTDTWSNGYKSVYHFDDRLDSLGVGGLGTILPNVNTSIQTNDKSCGSAMNITGRVYQITTWTPPVTPFGMTAFVIIDSSTVRSSIAGAYTAVAHSGCAIDFAAGTAYQTRFDWNGGGTSATPLSYYANATMTKWSGFRNASTYSALIKNGMLQNTTVLNTGAVASTSAMNLFSTNYTSGGDPWLAPFIGTITELRFHNDTRTDDWIFAEHNQTWTVGGVNNILPPYNVTSTTYAAFAYETNMTVHTSAIEVDAVVAGAKAWLNWSGTVMPATVVPAGITYTFNVTVVPPLEAINNSARYFNWTYELRYANGTLENFTGLGFNQNIYWAYYPYSYNISQVAIESQTLFANLTYVDLGYAAPVFAAYSTFNGTPHPLAFVAPYLFNDTFPAPSYVVPPNETLHSWGNLSVSFGGLTYIRNSTNENFTNVYDLSIDNCSTGNVILNYTAQDEITHAITQFDLDITLTVIFNSTYSVSFSDYSQNNTWRAFCVSSPFFNGTVEATAVYNEYGTTAYRGYLASYPGLGPAFPLDIVLLTLNGSYYTFIVTTQYGVPIQTANITSSRGGVITESRITNPDGSAAFLFKPFLTYQVNVSKPGYLPNIFNFTPGAITSVTIRLTPVDVPVIVGGYERMWDDVNYSLYTTPFGMHTFNNTFNITYNVSSLGAHFTNWGITINRTYSNGTNFTTTNIVNINSTNASGGNLTYSITMNGSYKVGIFFKHGNYSTFYMFDGYYFINGTDRLQQVREVLPSAIGGWAYFFMTMIIALLFMGYLNSYGLGDIAGMAGLGVLWFMTLFNPSAAIFSYAFGGVTWSFTIMIAATILTLIYVAYGIAKTMY